MLKIHFRTGKERAKEENRSKERSPRERSHRVSYIKRFHIKYWPTLAIYLRNFVNLSPWMSKQNTKPSFQDLNNFY